MRDYEAVPPMSGFGLSPRQALMWVDDQLFPDACYPNEPLVIELEGALDVDRIARAWTEVIAERDALRLSFRSDAPRQAYVQRQPPPLTVVNLTASDVKSWIAERCARRFTPDDFMWEAALLRITDDRHVFYLCQHHGLTDGLSQLLLVQDLADRYMGRSPAPAASFREYLDDEAAYLDSAKAQEDRAYWERKLEASAPPLRPYGIARKDPSVAIDRVWHDAGRSLSQQLCERAREPTFASFSDQLSRLFVVLTATAAFLHRVSGNREVVLAVPFANRPRRFARTCGLLMQQLFLRVRIEEGDTFADLAERVKVEFAHSVRHGRSCVSSRDIDYVRVNLLPSLPSQFGDLRARVQLDPATVRAGQRAGTGDLRDTFGIQLNDFADASLEVGFDCHAATYEPRVQQRIRGHFVRMLEALAADVDATIATVPLVDQDELRAILRAGRGPEPQNPAPDVVDAFEAQLRRRAEHVAVEGPGATLTYAQLEAASNRLARRLRALGVGRESRVGVALPRSTAELVALLATLKAGGAYVPVDPSHPLERVRVILADAAPDVLIAPPGSTLAAALPRGAKLLPLADLAQATSGWDDAPLGERPAREQLAYVLFTSGSTGRPKGVEITRGALSNFLRSMACTPGMSDSERLLSITTTTFDIAGLELFLPLWVGGTVVVADRDTARDAALLRKRLERADISIMQATPATWRLLVDAGFGGAPDLRMLCGGEALSPDLARRLLASGGELWNLYGPTETTVWSTLARIEPEFDRITIGTPIDRTQLYVLDEALQPVPSGCEGELWIGGDGVARGYRERPDLTEQRFIQNPHGPPGDRIYRTGDLGRLLEDGRFECLGRVDHQVKLRGFRIELGEIEAAIRSVPGVDDAVVLARGAAPADVRLCAYWTGDADRQAVFERARELLPDYMVPAAYLQLPEFPLTTSGKIDRNALPAAEPVAKPSSDSRRPKTELQTRFCAIWSEVLGTSQIGIDQDFFALGGTSVLAVEVRNRIERELGVELPLHAFFETPTIEGIARRLSGTAKGVDADSCLVRLRPSGGERCLFLIHDVDGEVLLYRSLAMHMPADVSVYGIVPRAERGLPTIHTSIGAMADHYVREVRARQPHGPYYLGGLCAGGVIAFEMARRLTLDGERVGLLALIDASAPGAKRVPLRVARQRLRRLGELATAGGGLGELVSAAAHRVANVASHELEATLSGLDTTVRMGLLEHVYADRDRAWPKRLAPPRVRDIYMRALARHAPAPIAGVPAVLFRATEGVDNVVPTREEFEDPCFGWRDLLGEAVEIVDVSGSHSTMLQEGRLDTIARRLRRAFEQPRLAPAPAAASDARSPRAVAAPGLESNARKIPKPRRTAVTVITVSHKTAALVERLLGSLAQERRRCSDRIDLRVLVVENASGDAPRLRAAISQHDYQSFTTLIEAPRNGGFAFGNNLGFEHAYRSGRAPAFFFLLNPDTEVRPLAVERLVRFMQQHTEVGIAGTRLESPTGEAWPYAYRFPSLLSEFEAAIGWSLITRLLRSRVVARRVADAAERVEWIPGAALMVRREVIDRLGGMDEGYFLYYEETDFCRKVDRAGFSVWYVPDSRVMHIGGQSTGISSRGGSRRRLPDYWFESRRRYFLKQHGLSYAIATDTATLAAHALGRLKLALQRRGPRTAPHYLRDLARHNTLLPSNRTLAPAREFHPARGADVESTQPDAGLVATGSG